MKLNYYERFKHWLHIEKRCPPDYRSHVTAATAGWLLEDAWAEIKILRAENRQLQQDKICHKTWTDNAKTKAGYPQNVSFDIVFDDLLDFYQREKGD
jgi:hypothetical protein